MTVSSSLHHQVYILGVMKDMVQFYEILMTHEGLKFYLSEKLGSDFECLGLGCASKSFLGDLFYCVEKACFLMAVLYG